MSELLASCLTKAYTFVLRSLLHMVLPIMLLPLSRYILRGPSPIHLPVISK